MSAIDRTGGRQVKIVKRVSGGVIVGDIEGHEIVPGVLDLGTFRSREAHSSHNLLQMLNRLSHWMKMPEAKLRTWQSWVRHRPIRRFDGL